MVYLAGRIAYVLAHMNGDGTDPLPIAIVSQVEADGASLPEFGLHLFHVLEHHAAAHLAFRHRGHLAGLPDVVHEVVIEPAFDAFDFLQRLLGEAFRQVLAHHLAPIAHQPVHHPVEAVGQHIHQSERKQRQQFPHPEQQSVLHILSPSHISVLQNRRIRFAGWPSPCSGGRRYARAAPGWRPRRCCRTPRCPCCRGRSVRC